MDISLVFELVCREGQYQACRNSNKVRCKQRAPHAGMHYVTLGMSWALLWVLSCLLTEYQTADIRDAEYYGMAYGLARHHRRSASGAPRRKAKPLTTQCLPLIVYGLLIAPLQLAACDWCFLITACCFLPPPSSCFLLVAACWLLGTAWCLLLASRCFLLAVLLVLLGVYCSLLTWKQ